MVTPTVAVIVARSFATAKSRLARHLDSADVARAMLAHVLTAVRGEVDAMVVATDGEDVAALARAAGAQVVWDVEDVAALGDAAGARIDSDGGDRAAGGATKLSRIVDRALVAVERGGAGAAIVLMADLPLLRAQDVRRMRAALGDADVVLAPDARDLGTNAIGVRLPAAPTCFGNADSFPRHVAAAAGKRLALVRTRGLAFDLDQPADFVRLIGITSRENANRGSRVSAA